MGDKEKEKNVRPEAEADREQGGNKRKAINDKLRKKLEKLKKDDPNIYPVF